MSGARRGLSALVVVWCATANLTAQGTLDDARRAVAEGDSSVAIRILRRIGDMEPETPTSAALMALLALRWMGQSPSYAGTVDGYYREQRGYIARALNDVLSDQAAPAVRQYAMDRSLPPAKVVFLLAEILWRRPPRETIERRRLNMGGDWASLDAMAEDERVDPLVRGGAAWVYALYRLSQFDSVLSGAIPRTERLPVSCPRTAEGRTAGDCIAREDPMNSSWRLDVLLTRDDSVSAYFTAARAALRRAATAPWPVSDLAAQTIVGLEALVGSRNANWTDLAAFDLDPTTRNLLTATQAEFAGLRETAAAEMLAHPEWYEELDRDRRGLSEARLSAPVFWRTAWPFFLEPFNARLVVHRARLLLADIWERVILPEGGVHSFVQRGVLVRRGLPVALARQLVDSSRHGLVFRQVEFLDPRIHETTLRSTTREADAPRLDLGLAAARDPRATISPSGYVPADVDRMDPLEHQVVQSLRDGQTMVEFWVTKPPLCRERRPVFGFFLMDDHLALIRRVIDTTSVATDRYRLMLPLAPADYIYSLEMIDRPCRVGARSRYVLTVRNIAREGISDLMLSDSLRLRDPRRVPGERPMDTRAGWLLRADTPVHLYWELYGVEADTTDQHRLAVNVEVRNVGGRVAVRALRLVARAANEARPSLDVEYDAAVPAGTDPLGMAMSVGLPPDANGVHVVRVEVRDRRTNRRWSTERAFYVEPAR